MDKIRIAVHTGTGIHDPWVQAAPEEHLEGMRAAIRKGLAVLRKGGNALDAVQSSVMALEDNPLFNAGRGSALNAEGKAEMSASIMDGRRMKFGAAALLPDVKNPVALSRRILESTRHVILTRNGTSDLIRKNKIRLMPESYFVTDKQVDTFLEQQKKHPTYSSLLKQPEHGTVGAVAMDKKGNLAAALSTGGTLGCLPGRISDVCIAGAGLYAENGLAAISCSGDGEFLITHVFAHSIASLLKGHMNSIQAACETMVRKVSPEKADVAVISIDHRGNYGIAFNNVRMNRAWLDKRGEIRAALYL